MTKGYAPFKMKGNPMKRNFGIGASPTKATDVVDPDANVARATTQKTATGPMMKEGSPAKSEHVPGRSGKKPHDMGGGREAAYHPDKGSTIKGAGITKTGSPVKHEKSVWEYLTDEENAAARAHNKKHIEAGDWKEDMLPHENPKRNEPHKDIEGEVTKKLGSPAKRKHNLKPADIDKGGREAAFKPDTNVMRKTGSPAKKGKKSRGKTKRRDHTNPLYDISPI